jgi:multiple antibiotic resistance protein
MKITFNNLLQAFIPIFVAIDIPGAIPLFLSLTDGMDRKARRQLTIEATMTAGAVALIFLVAGKIIFRFLGITENDFRIGGGIVLLVLAVNELLFASDKDKVPGQSVGVVPIGIPLIMGPAALTAIIIVLDNYGYWLAITSLLLNLFIVWLVFRHADKIMTMMGEAGAKGFAKVAALFLAAIAVMMIRVGIQNILR